MLIAFHLRYELKLSDIRAHRERESQRPSASLKRRLHGANKTSYARDKITRWTDFAGVVVPESYFTSLCGPATTTLFRSRHLISSYHLTQRMTQIWGTEETKKKFNPAQARIRRIININSSPPQLPTCCYHLNYPPDRTVLDGTCTFLLLYFSTTLYIHTRSSTDLVNKTDNHRAKGEPSIELQSNTLKM